MTVEGTQTRMPARVDPVGRVSQSGGTALPRVLFLRVTTAAALHPWFDDFVAAVDGTCDVQLFDPAESMREQFRDVRVVVDLGGFGTHELIDAGRDAGVQLWQVLGYGLDHIDVPYVHASGMPLAHTPGSCTAVALAEHALHLMLNVEKRWAASQDVLASAQYGEPFSGELDGQTLGIVGFGASGRALGQRALAFGMRVIAVDAIPPADGDADAAACEYLGGLESLDQLLRDSDYVSLHLPLSDETRHLLDARALAQMKRTAVIVNVARGPLIDQAALVDALRAGTLRGVGLDVFEDEPLPPDHPLVGIEDAVLTPHVAGLTRESSKRRARFAAENVARALTGDKPIDGVVT